MISKAYLKTDVLILQDIQENYLYSSLSSKGNRFDCLLKIKNIYTSEITVNCLGIDIEKAIENINIQKYGFRNIDDVKIKSIPVVFDNAYKISLVPLKIYGLKDKIDLPIPPTEKNSQFLYLLSDTFERLKFKAENVVDKTDNSKRIELYAKKNLQMLNRIFYDSKLEIIDIKATKDKEKIVNAFIFSVFIINTILYFQKMFSSFYSEDIKTKEKLRYELFDTYGMEMIFERIKEDKTTCNDISQKNIKLNPIMWNGQVNTLLTLIYDLMNHRLENGSRFMVANIELILHFLNKYVIDKNGKSINKNTSRICLYDYREDKRSKRNKKISIKKYIEMDE